MMEWGTYKPRLMQNFVDQVRRVEAAERRQFSVQEGVVGYRVVAECTSEVRVMADSLNESDATELSNRLNLLERRFEP